VQAFRVGVDECERGAATEVHLVGVQHECRREARSHLDHLRRLEASQDAVQGESVTAGEQVVVEPVPQLVPLGPRCSRDRAASSPMSADAAPLERLSRTVTGEPATAALGDRASHHSPGGDRHVAHDGIDDLLGRRRGGQPGPPYLLDVGDGTVDLQLALLHD